MFHDRVALAVCRCSGGQTKMKPDHGLGGQASYIYGENQQRVVEIFKPWYMFSFLFFITSV